MQARAVIIYSIQKTRNARTATACRGSGTYGYKEVRRHVHLLGKGLGSTRNQLPRCPVKSNALNGRCALAADGFWRATFQARVDIATPSRFPGENGSSRPKADAVGTARPSVRKFYTLAQPNPLTTLEKAAQS